jgi:hypothetical protein
VEVPLQHPRNGSAPAQRSATSLPAWWASLVLAAVVWILLLWGAQGPWHGDGAIGIALVAGAAAVVFLVQALFVTPLLLWQWVRDRGSFRASAGWLLALPVVLSLLAWGMILLVDQYQATR